MILFLAKPICIQRTGRIPVITPSNLGKESFVFASTTIHGAADPYVDSQPQLYPGRTNGDKLFGSGSGNLHGIFLRAKTFSFRAQINQQQDEPWPNFTMNSIGAIITITTESSASWRGIYVSGVKLSDRGLGRLFRQLQFHWHYGFRAHLLEAVRCCC